MGVYFTGIWSSPGWDSALYNFRGKTKQNLCKICGKQANICIIFIEDEMVKYFACRKLKNNIRVITSLPRWISKRKWYLGGGVVKGTRFYLCTYEDYSKSSVMNGFPYAKTMYVWLILCINILHFIIHAHVKFRRNRTNINKVIGLWKDLSHMHWPIFEDERGKPLK